MRRSWQARIACLAGTAALLSGCAVSPVGTAVAPEARTSQPSATPSSGTPAVATTTTPAAPASTPAASASATTEPTTLAKAPAKTADAYSVTSLSGSQRRSLGSCLNTTIAPGTSGSCTKKALTMLTSAGFYKGATNYVGVAAANAILNYQRSRGILPTATIAKVTWTALATKAPAVPEITPDICLAKGVNVCVDKAHRKAKWYRDGKLVKTFSIRVGGWNSSPKTGTWRVYPTANGLWKVYDKQVNPYSENYGAGAMPYSTMFYPDMYFHASAGFTRDGYAGSSHGCVNMHLADAKWVFKNTPIGAAVYIYGGL